MTTKITWTEEMFNTIADLMDADNYNPDTACATCPYNHICGKNNDMYFGCGVWEDQMGEDL